MLEAKALFFSYADVFSLSDINIAVKPAEIIGIIGQSGSGKSTLLRLLAGLLNKNSGDILLKNEYILGPSHKLVPGHSKIKLMTQSNTLFPNVNIFENIAYELRTFSKEYQVQRVSYLTKHFKVFDLLQKYPRELSGGEIQRVMLAKALADEPQVLLLDEPFANIDSINKRKAVLFLQKIIRKEKIACIWVTHDLADAFGYTDSVIVMRSGKIIEKTEPEKLYFKPRSKYIAALTGDYFSLEKNGKFVTIRPEQIEVSKNGDHSAIVEKSIFKGGYYEVLFFLNEQLLFFKSSKSFNSGEEIHFSINFPA
jgi:ABC-type Fe3+/spermidine/putrescine transport system ATPase subunit